MIESVWIELRARRGTVKRVAEGLGISTAAVSQWHKVPSERVGQVAELLHVSARDLRPDLHREAHEGGDFPGVRVSKIKAEVLVDSDLLREAVAEGVDLSATLGEALRNKLGVARRERWLAENRRAIAASHDFLEEHGLWSDGLRQF